VFERRSYAKFNAASRKLNARLIQLGAVPLVERGLGDDQSTFGVDGDLDTWLPAMWAAALTVWPLPSDYVIDDTPKLIPSPYTASVKSASERSALARAEVLGRCFESPRGSYSPCLLAKLVSNTRMTVEDWEQDVRHLVLDVSDAR
jgi:sulfite reductase alpha subunit-like flavoprotein